MVFAIWMVCFSIFSQIWSASAGSFVEGELDVSIGTPIDAPPNSVLIGDMIFKRRGATLGSVVLPWRGGVFVYEYDAAVTAPQRAAFDAACQAWMVGTPLTCRIRSNEADYAIVVTHTGDRCGNSASSCAVVGMQGGEQFIYIHANHWSSSYVLQHEIGHALGLVHEHQRNDRDHYVYINGHNIMQGQASQFALWSISPAFSTDYDFASIMHYPNCAYSLHNNCSNNTPQFQTIVPRACDRDVVGGFTITALDIDAIRHAYAAPLQAALVHERVLECGTTEYSTEQSAQVCGGSCAAASAVRFRKIDTLEDNWCGFMAPIPDPPKHYCTPLEKEYIRHWWDHDDTSCGRLGTETRHELWVECGCPYQSVQGLCANIQAFDAAYVSSYKQASGNWRIGRVLHFQEVMDELRHQGALTDQVAKSLGLVYQLNYLDRKFETKMARVRAGVYSYARWRRSLDGAYALDLGTFRKIAKYRKLRTD
ncbi:M12 family metallopeptidase [Sinorhizobium meliloti]|uniref:M12 family metallopeptidase n=1 Tax=Rhizobium meliloti TaxID=382 RepID=UPI001865905E